ncbi:MAG: hypothetical protein ACRETM_01210 [Stenotrophobium sp.]
MFAQTLEATVRILFLRAGPQDFPYASGLTPALVALAVLANGLVFSRVLPPPMALGIALAMVAALAMVTRSILRMRDVLNRFQQTFNALLATTAVLTLALLPGFTQMAPQILELAKHPELLEKPDAVHISGIAVFFMNLINFWNFIVTAHIFRHAANVNLWVGIVIAFVAAGVMLFVGMIGGSITSVLFGGLAG